MSMVRWFLWLVLLALLTGGVYFYLERRAGEKTPPAVDRTTEQDRRQLDQLIDKLQKQPPPEKK